MCITYRTAISNNTEIVSVKLQIELGGFPFPVSGNFSHFLCYIYYIIHIVVSLGCQLCYAVSDKANSRALRDTVIECINCFSLVHV